jgi:CoA-transferase family III
MSTALPLAGIRVVEFSHMVMGSSCGLVLGDLGADVIKIEPVGEGDNTRRLPGSGAGFFPTFNRNKRSSPQLVRTTRSARLRPPDRRHLRKRVAAICDSFYTILCGHEGLATCRLYLTLALQSIPSGAWAVRPRSRALCERVGLVHQLLVRRLLVRRLLVRRLDVKTVS